MKPPLLRHGSIPLTQTLSAAAARPNHHTTAAGRDAENSGAKLYAGLGQNFSLPADREAIRLPSSAGLRQ